MFSCYLWERMKNQATNRWMHPPEKAQIQMKWNLILSSNNLDKRGIDYNYEGKISFCYVMGAKRTVFGTQMIQWVISQYWYLFNGILYFKDENIVNLLEKVRTYYFFSWNNCPQDRFLEIRHLSCEGDYPTYKYGHHFSWSLLRATRTQRWHWSPSKRSPNYSY